MKCLLPCVGRIWLSTIQMIQINRKTNLYSDENNVYEYSKPNDKSAMKFFN